MIKLEKRGWHRTRWLLLTMNIWLLESEQTINWGDLGIEIR